MGHYPGWVRTLVQQFFEKKNEHLEERLTLNVLLFFAQFCSMQYTGQMTGDKP